MASSEAQERQRVELDIYKGDFKLLSENDIPGMSLDGKQPSELNLTQLKRWLAYRGAPTNGKKPSSVGRKVSKLNFFLTLHCFCRMKCYGWDVYLTDPDGGKNCLQKLASVNLPGSESQRLLQKFAT